MAQFTLEEKRNYAKLLYVTVQGITQKEIAARVGATEATISKWVKVEKWEDLKVSLLTTKSEQLNLLYLQLKELNQVIHSREVGQRFSNSKEADTLIKITAAIKNLEVETSIAEKVEVGQDFLHFVRQAAGMDFSKEAARYFDAYIKSKL